MKTLYLVRHAKSGWEIESQPDVDRPLNERGYREAHMVSKHLQKQKFRPDVIVSSPAVRAVTTALIFAGNLKYSKEDILIRTALYETSKGEYVNTIHELSDEANSAMLFGHNPIISETASYLLHKFNDDLPTCCIIAMEFDLKSWKEVAKNSGKLMHSLSPADLKDD